MTQRLQIIADDDVLYDGNVDELGVLFGKQDGHGINLKARTAKKIFGLGVTRVTVTGQHAGG